MPILLGFPSPYKFLYTIKKLLNSVRVWEWVLLHINKVEGLEYEYKIVNYFTHYQLVLGWNLIWACIHGSFVESPIDIKKFNMVLEWVARFWCATISIWLKLYACIGP